MGPHLLQGTPVLLMGKVSGQDWKHCSVLHMQRYCFPPTIIYAKAPSCFPGSKVTEPQLCFLVLPRHPDIFRRWMRLMSTVQSCSIVEATLDLELELESEDWVLILAYYLSDLSHSVSLSANWRGWLRWPWRALPSLYPWSTYHRIDWSYQVNTGLNWAKVWPLALRSNEIKCKKVK